MTDGPAVATSSLDAPVPVVLSVPHGGTFLPAACTDALRIDPATLWSDWYTAELYDLTREFAVPTVMAMLSRFVADPNRAPVAPLHGNFWSTAVPATDPAGAPLYDRQLRPDELQERLDLAHAPYHRALDRAVTAALRRHPRVLLLDLHSFGLPLGPDVVLGDGDGSTARAEAGDRVEQALRHEGFTVARNLRFTGGHIVRRWVGEPRVDAVQVELDQRCYLVDSDVEGNRPQPRRDPAGWARTRQAVTAAIRALASG
ncbi:N-formylglutamate amidohydrolase [Blastococcus goldschmidtiae]|uniref:N-formylglutamate amidohydrolase n=1 Tax=Blastococcus goldschmidtiae TaxID=3075546 RepID=A0ABU2K9Q7_9ACTN|nr:N-formylglutamate amidohydrolase [Blastococcus sp. DSM 46792]MDT0276913.1 N-formylglutamate amidohydrolase [Blastococcus sp. DSM 46792]